MKIGVDLDDVLADCLKSLLEFHNSYYQTNHKPGDVLEFEMNSTWGTSKTETRRRIAQFFTTRYFDQMTPLANAIDGINQIKNCHNLIVITSRPDFIRSQTEEWVEKYFPGTFGRVHFAGSHLGFNKLSKSDICASQGVDLMIEDAPRYITECAEKGIKTLIFDQPWNKNFALPKGCNRVYNWPEIVEIIRDKNN